MFVSDEGFTRRIEQLVQEAGGQNAFARRLGMSQSGVARLVKGGEPTLSTLKAIANASGKSLAWVANGETSAPDSALDMVNVPMLDVQASAGGGRLNEDPEAIGYLPFSRDALKRLGVNAASARVVVAVGDSMSPTILDGAHVLIDTAAKRLIDGRIYTLWTPEGLRLKRIIRNVAGTVTLVSDNKEMYPPEVLTIEEIETIGVVGRAFWTEKQI